MELFEDNNFKDRQRKNSKKTKGKKENKKDTEQKGKKKIKWTYVKMPSLLQKPEKEKRKATKGQRLLPQR